MKHEPAIAVVGTSAGGVKALEQLVASLPGDLNTALFIVLRLSPSMPSELAAILQRCARLPVAERDTVAGWTLNSRAASAADFFPEPTRFTISCC